MRWPGRIPAGTTCDQIAGNIDLLPTFAKLVGVETDKDRILDGRDITPLMFDPLSGPVRETHLYFTARQSLAAIRQGDWKLLFEASANNAPGKKAGKKKTKAKSKKKTKAKSKKKTMTGKLKFGGDD